MSPSRQRANLVIGLMSGTSADAIDVALVNIASSERKTGTPAQLENFAAFPLPADIRATVLRMGEGAPTTAGEISQLNFRIGGLLAKAVLEACRKFRISPAQVNLVGSHGQTIYHQGAPSRFLGARVSSTMQIGEPSIIAAETGITTVADFRPADIAVGGQGAPLVPFVDYLLYRDARRGRVALNIGGIANISVIPPAARPEDVFAFDTGPGNMVVDALVRRFWQGRGAFDRDARIAARGRFLPELADSLLADAYFRRPAPKTAGREQYGEAYVHRIIQRGKQLRAKPADLVRTATVVTALSIADALRRMVMPQARVSQLIVAGGGARNPLMMAQLAAALPELEILPSDALGIPGDAKEAFAFALLAHETIHGRPANLPCATGALRPAILGKVCYAPPR